MTDDDVPVLQEIIEKEIILYQQDRFPAGAIGPVALLLIPNTCSSGSGSSSGTGNSSSIQVCNYFLFSCLFSWVYYCIL